MRNQKVEKEHLSALQAVADATPGSVIYMGRIRHISHDAGGVTDIQIDVDTGAGYSSYWPAWTHEFAKMALLHNKRVAVVSNGEPYGQNITHLTVLIDPA